MNLALWVICLPNQSDAAKVHYQITPGYQLTPVPYIRSVRMNRRFMNELLSEAAPPHHTHVSVPLLALLWSRSHDDLDR